MVARRALVVVGVGERPSGGGCRGATLVARRALAERLIAEHAPSALVLRLRTRRQVDALVRGLPNAG